MMCYQNKGKFLSMKVLLCLDKKNHFADTCWKEICYQNDDIKMTCSKQGQILCIYTSISI